MPSETTLRRSKTSKQTLPNSKRPVKPLKSVSEEMERKKQMQKYKARTGDPLEETPSPTIFQKAVDRPVSAPNQK